MVVVCLKACSSIIGCLTGSSCIVVCCAVSVVEIIGGEGIGGFSCIGEGIGYNKIKKLIFVLNLFLPLPVVVEVVVVFLLLNGVHCQHANNGRRRKGLKIRGKNKRVFSNCGESQFKLYFRTPIKQFISNKYRYSSRGNLGLSEEEFLQNEIRCHQNNTNICLDLGTGRNPFQVQ